MCFQPLGEPKNAEKRSSSVDEMRKTQKNSLSYPYDEQKMRKTAFRRGTTDKKTLKIGFPPRPKSKKQQKKHFGRGRN